jgi:site-specific recombinase XerD
MGKSGGRRALHPREPVVSAARNGAPRVHGRLERLSDAFDLRDGLTAKGDITISEAFNLVRMDWSRQAQVGNIQTATIETHGRVLETFESFLTAHRVERICDITQVHLLDFQQALTTYTHEPPTQSMQMLRRSVARAMFTTAACLGITDRDLTGSMERYNKPDRVIRPLSTRELELVKSAAESDSRGIQGSTKMAAAVALAILGGHSKEIPQVTVRDIDLLEGKIWVRGQEDRIRARWLPIDDNWCFEVLLARVAYLREQHADGAEHITVAYSIGKTRGGKFVKNPAAATTNLIDKTLKRSGIQNSRYVRVASITESLAYRIWAETHRLEAVAVRLGMRSLDRVVDLLQHDWAKEFTIDHEPGQPS